MLTIGLDQKIKAIPSSLPTCYVDPARKCYYIATSMFVVKESEAVESGAFNAIKDSTLKVHTYSE